MPKRHIYSGREKCGRPGPEPVADGKKFLPDVKNVRVGGREDQANFCGQLRLPNS